MANMPSKGLHILCPIAVTLISAQVLVGALGQQVQPAGERFKISWADNTSSLLATRRRQDEFFLPLWRAYLDESPKASLAKSWSPNGEARELRYYANERIKTKQISEDDLIFEAINQDYLSRLLEPYSHRFDDPADRQRAADPSKVSPSKCDVQLDYLLDKLGQLESAHSRAEFGTGMSPELATFFDAFATKESGLVMGNSFWTGNWRQCYRRELVAPLTNGSLMTFSGRYCVASLRSPSWSRRIKENVNKLKAEDYFRHDKQHIHYERYFRVKLGVCLPEACDSLALQRRPSQVRRLVTHRVRSHPIGSRYQLIDLYCLPDENSELRKVGVSGRVLISILVVWLACLLWASQEHWRLLGAQAGRPSALVLSLSLIESYRTFVTVSAHTFPPLRLTGHKLGAKEREQSAERQAELSPRDLAFLNGVKVLLMPAILIGHCALVIQQMCKHPLDFNVISPLSFHIVAGAAFWVDWYFCISGFLCAYASLATAKRPLKSHSLAHWLYTVFHRYVRLAPIYLLLFWFNRSLFHLMGQGPVWDYGTSESSVRAVCRRESWLTPLSLSANLHPLHQECIMPAWFISAEMQFYLVTPALLILVESRPLLGRLVCLLAVLGCLLARFKRYLVDPHVKPLELIRPRYDLPMRNNWDLHQTYLYPHYRISPYLIGLLAGHHVYLVRTSKLKPQDCAKLKRRLTVLAWTGLTAGVAMNLASLLMDKLLPERLFEAEFGQQARLLAALIYSSHHTLAGLACALFLVALALGAWPCVRKLLEQAALARLARLNYFVYLAQVELLYYLQGTHDWMPDSSGQEMARLFVLTLTLIYPISLLVQLCVANPLARLEREFAASLFGLAQQQQQQQPQQARLSSGRAKQPRERPSGQPVARAPST